jgi:hypothetical protein
LTAQIQTHISVTFQIPLFMGTILFGVTNIAMPTTSNSQPTTTKTLSSQPRLLVSMVWSIAKLCR